MSKKDKQPTVTCPACGAENAIYAAFCKECGGRMYKDGAGPGAIKQQGKVSKRRRVRHFISSIILLGLITGCVLAFWPLPSSDIPTTTARNRGVSNFLAQVQTVQRTGEEMEDVKMSQSSLNAFLGRHARPDRRMLLGAVLSENRLLIMASEPLLGPLNISSRLELKPKGDESGQLVPVNFYVGKLPLPARLIPFWAERMIEMFELDVELETLEALRIRRLFNNGMVIGADVSK